VKVPTEEESRGMTPNERLFAAGILEEFDEATRIGDSAGMIACLMRAHFSEGEAANMARIILAHPTRYGRLR